MKHAKRIELTGREYGSFAALEAHPSARTVQADAKVHGTTHEAPSFRFEASRAQCPSSAPGPSVLWFGPPGVGTTHLPIQIGREVIEAGNSVLFTSATALLAALARAESEGQLPEKLTCHSNSAVPTCSSNWWLDVTSAAAC